MGLPEPKWSDSKAKNWFRKEGINQDSTKYPEGKIDAFWAFNEFVDTNEIRPQTSEEEYPKGVTTSASMTPSPSEKNGDDGGKDNISARINVSDKRRIAIAARSESGTDIILFLIDLFKLVKNLLSCENIPDEVKLTSGMKDKLKAKSFIRLNF